MTRSFSSIFWALKLVWEIFKNFQMFKRCFTPCLFLSAKNLTWYYLIFSPVSLTENGKFAKTANVQSFPLIFGSLETSLETLKKKISSRYPTSCILFQEKIWDCRNKTIKIVLYSDTKIRPGKTSFCQYLLWKVKT